MKPSLFPRRHGMGVLCKEGFSLIELMVVVAILGILAMLLLPAMGKGRAAARRVICANHLRHWGMALQTYSDDCRGFLPRESYIPHEVARNLWAQVRNTQAEDVWYNALADYAGVPAASFYAPAEKHAKFYRGGVMFHCPEARFSPDISKDSVAFFSLAMNSKLIMSPFTTVKLSGIKNPSSTILFQENRLRGEPKVDEFQSDFELGQPSAYANRFSIRHGGRGQLLFGDQHVELIRGAEVVTNGLAFFPQSHIVWTLDSGTDPNIYY